MNNLENLDLTHSFYQLGADFYQSKLPDPVSDPFLVNFSPSAAELIGLDPSEAQKQEFVEYFSGNRPLPGSQPLAMAYSGHQFGSYNPRLGDGRGLLLGEVRNGLNTWDIYLKGCGPTRYSRGFDGRATLRSSIREHLGCEALHGLGIPTTRSLAIIGIGDVVYREYPQAGAILVRLSESHVRFGSFQHFHFTDRPEKVTRLADYVIQRHFPECHNDPKNQYRLLFRAVLHSTASLIALWQSVGFIHGVMNTDNMAINGVTFDYGPYGFMDRFNPGFTPNASDGYGRYAYGQQARIAHWNLIKLGETFKHLLDPSMIIEELESFPKVYDGIFRGLMAKKLGLRILDSEFTALVDALFALLNDSQPDFTLFFRHLSSFPEDSGNLRQGFNNIDALDHWLRSYRTLIEREDCDPAERKRDMDKTNPRFILRNYLLERAIAKVLKDSDYTEVERLRVLLSDPYSDRPEIFARYGIDAGFYASETPEPHVEMQLSCSA